MQITKLLTCLVRDGEEHLVLAISQTMMQNIFKTELKSHDVQPCSEVYNYTLDSSGLQQFTEFLRKKKYSNDEFRVKNMSTNEHADVMSKAWKFGNSFSAQYGEFACKNDLAFGAFTEQGEVVAWGQHFWYGYGGSLVVRPEWRNKGLAARVTFAQAKFFLQDLKMDFYPVFVETENRVSQDMFPKFGFVPDGTTTYFLKVAPKTQ